VGSSGATRNHLKVVGRFTDDKLDTDVMISDELASKLRCATDDGSLWPAR
jgi:hypothetical protein